MKISCNMMFWDDGQPESTRLRNVQYCWEKLKIQTSTLKARGLDITCNLFDFSPTILIPDSIHIPYPLGEYKKAEKNNIMFKHEKETDFFMMYDSDAFFDYKDYDSLYAIFSNLKKGDIVTFDLAKLEDNINDYILDGIFVKENAKWSYAYSGDAKNGPLHQRLGGLGGVFLVDTQLILGLGGFDEKYVGWGGEDGDMLNRVCISGQPYSLKPERNIAPFHIPHYSDWSSKLYSQRFAD